MIDFVSANSADTYEKRLYAKFRENKPLAKISEFTASKFKLYLSPRGFSTRTYPYGFCQRINVSNATQVCYCSICSYTVLN